MPQNDVMVGDLKLSSPDCLKYTTTTTVKHPLAFCGGKQRIVVEDECIEVIRLFQAWFVNRWMNVGRFVSIGIGSWPDSINGILALLI